MTSAQLPAEEQERKQRCWIHLENDRISIDFTPGLPDGSHKVTRVETMAAAALIGIARALTGRGEQEVLGMLQQFDAKQKRRRP